MTISEIINELDNSTGKGFQISKRKGVLNSTWLIYKRKGFYYYFDINDDIRFIKSNRYTREELENEFPNSFFMIDLIIK